MRSNFNDLCELSDPNIRIVDEFDSFVFTKKMGRKLHANMMFEDSATDITWPESESNTDADYEIFASTKDIFVDDEHRELVNRLSTVLAVSELTEGSKEDSSSEAESSLGSDDEDNVDLEEAACLGEGRSEGLDFTMHQKKR